MTPAIDLLSKTNANFTLREYQPDPNASSYGLEAAQKLGVTPGKVFKTLVVADTTPGKKSVLVVGIVPVNGSLNLKTLARAAGRKKLNMAAPVDVQRATGYVMGGVSPLGQKKRLPIYVDSSAQEHDTVYISAGKRGLEIELTPADLCRLTGATLAAIAHY
ncbi:Cys-tRNA(Pro) deacylase [uncultured Gilvimarinus sp.]|uniref:Cys-tRNA(Pro) deacylase n=1 Tax=uncultured Gilvimarinus sp. TaxID=1689143 RepID=UPI0030D86B16